VLEELVLRVSKLTVGRLDDVGFVCVQHLLETTGSLFESLVRLGARPGNMFVLGKCYSTNAKVLRRLSRLGVRVWSGTKPDQWGRFTTTLDRDITLLWDEAIRDFGSKNVRSIIVLDDGGHCLAFIPRKRLSDFVFVGVEQTTRGYEARRNMPGRFPIIQVARSAAKQYVEPPMISQAVVARVSHLMAGRNGRVKCGVVGLGRIGQAVATHLVNLGHRVVVTDLSVALSDQLKSIEWNGTALGVLSSADLIFGCTGRDIFKRKKLPKGLGGAKILASCSTGDNEFLTLLKRAAGEQRRDTNVPFGDASLAQPNGSLTILRGGFPINFDGSRESVAASDIQLTRGLLLGGIVQAVLARGQRREGDERWEKLDPGMQRFVVETWLKSREVRRPWYPETLLRNFEDESWVREESRGYDASYPMLAGAFGH
jgi:hypothetical protein